MDTIDAIKKEYSRIHNTYHYTIQSNRLVRGVAGAGNTQLSGNFEFDIPPFPFPQHNNSQLGILKIKSFYIVGQDSTDAERTSGSVSEDTPAFYVRLRGFGLRPQQFSNNFTAAQVVADYRKGPAPQTDIFVPNDYAMCENATDGNTRYDLQLNAGCGNLNYEFPISNPAGSTCSVQVFYNGGDLTPNQQLAENGYHSQITFSIELLPDEVSQN